MIQLYVVLQFLVVGPPGHLGQHAMDLVEKESRSGVECVIVLCPFMAVKLNVLASPFKPRNVTLIVPVSKNI